MGCYPYVCKQPTAKALDASTEGQLDGFGNALDQNDLNARFNPNALAHPKRALEALFTCATGDGATDNTAAMLNVTHAAVLLLVVGVAMTATVYTVRKYRKERTKEVHHHHHYEAAGRPGKAYSDKDGMDVV